MSELHRFVLPVEGLTIPSPWVIGPVRLRLYADVRSEIDGVIADMQPQGREWFDERSSQILDSHTTIAEVEAVDIDSAVTTVTAALDVLTVYQRFRHNQLALIGNFGLPGRVRRAVVRYLHVGETSGWGSTSNEMHVGFSFRDEDLAAWNESAAFQFVAQAVADPEPSDEGNRRASVGVQMLAQSLLAERKSPLRYVFAVMALDILLADGPGAQTFALARRSAYFGCDVVEGKHCGRDWETCPYLALDPTKKADREKLNSYKDRSYTDNRIHCSEWLQVVEWYEDRSGYVHKGIPPEVRQGRPAPDYWIYRWLLEPILLWLREHPDTPIADLDAEISSLPPAPDCEARWASEDQP